MPKAFGLDFGTTNSAVACASDSGVETTPVHRSVLYFEPKVATATGNDAIDRYLAADEKGQLDLVRSKGMKVVQPDVAAFRAATADVYKKYEKAWGVGFYERVRDAK